MNIENFNKTNEKLKFLISSFQIKKSLDMKKFRELHEKLITMSDEDNDLYEDLIIRLKSAYNMISIGNFEYLAKDYHDALWRLHQRIMQTGTKVPPDIFKNFHNALVTKTEKFYFENTALCQLGLVEGHCITVSVLDGNMKLEYNDHSPVRTEMIVKRLWKRKWAVSKMTMMKGVFPKGQTENNYFFTAEKKYDDDELERLGKELSLSIDTDWILVTSECNDPVKLAVEKILTEMAYEIYEMSGILPKDILQDISKLYDKLNEKKT